MRCRTAGAGCRELIRGVVFGAGLRRPDLPVPGSASSLSRMRWERPEAMPCGPFGVACGQPGHQPPPSAR